MSDEKKETEKSPGFSVRDKRRIHLDEDASTPSSESEPEAGSSTERESEPERSSSTEEGPDAQTADEEGRPSADQIKSAEHRAEAAGKQHRQAPEVDFTTFVISLASSAMVHLGQVEHPDAKKAEVNLPMAKQVVDMLAMLQDKTKGNLEPDEERYLEAILYDLRLRFVDASKSHKSDG